MSNLPEITLSLHERPIQCPHCGHYCHPQDAQCPECGEELNPSLETVTALLKNPPLTLPVDVRSINALAPNAPVILQFLPSAICVTLDLKKPTILGRGLSLSPDEYLDLTYLNAQKHGISRQHCRLERYQIRLAVTDLNSKNGTYLNGERIPSFEAQPVNNGSELILGTLRLVVFFSSARE